MNRYKLSYIMHEPSEDTEDKFMAEIPALPGCRAWGDSPAETLYILEGVAQAFIQSYLEDGQPLPEGVVPIPVPTGTADEVVVLALPIGSLRASCADWVASLTDRVVVTTRFG